MVSIFVRRKKKESSPNDVDDNSKSKDYIDITDMSDKEKYVEISRKIDNLEKLVLANS